MKTLIVYSSVHHGNTEKIGKVMAKSMDADIVKDKDFASKNLNDYGLVGFGSGIYKGKFHKNILNIIESIDSQKNKKAFVFSTSGMGREAYNNTLKNLLKEKGFYIVGSFSCKGYDTFSLFKAVGGIAKGRPNEEDMNKAEEFAKSLK